MSEKARGGSSLLSALSPEKRREAGRAAAKDAKEGTTRFYDDFLADGLKQDHEEADRKDLQVYGETAVGSMTPEQRKAAGKATAKKAIEEDPSILSDVGPAIEDEDQIPSGRNEIRFTSTKPDKNGLTPQQRKELGKQAAKGAAHSPGGSGQ